MGRRRRIRQHVNPLSLRHMDTGARRVALPLGALAEAELGCAEGEFLFARARAAPGRFLVGVEIRQQLVERINRQAAAQGSAVMAVYANLNMDLDRLFAPSSLAVCHVNFPDPCFKRSQHKRRFLTPELASSICRVLRLGGLLSVQTDIWDLALEALEILESGGELVNELGPWSFARENIFAARTRRERRCMERGKKIWRLRFSRPVPATI